MTAALDSRWGARLNDLALGVSGPVMVIGTSDAGKSTLCAWLVQRLVGLGRRAALVDSDLGQTQVGPPACVGLAVFEDEAPDLQPVVPTAMAFVGDTSPAGRLIETALAASRMVRAAAGLGAAVTVVNTSGLVLGEHGRRLKLAKAELIRPQVVVALERQGELGTLAGLLASQCQTEVWRLTVPEGVRPKSFDERRRWREGRFKAYFSGARPLELDTREVPIMGCGLGGGASLAASELDSLEVALRTPVVHAERHGASLWMVVEEEALGPGVTSSAYPGRVAAASSWRGLVCGLLGRAGQCLALGLVERWRREGMTLLTPLPRERAAEVAAVELAALGLGEGWREFRPAGLWRSLDEMVLTGR